MKIPMNLTFPPPTPIHSQWFEEDFFKNESFLSAKAVVS